MSEIGISEKFQQALESESFHEVEEYWLEALDSEIIPVTELLEVRRLLWKMGKKTLARTLLELLAETLEERKDAQSTLRVLRDLLRLTEKPPGTLLKRIENALREAYSDKPSLEAVMKHDPIVGSRKPLKSLETVETWLNFDIGSPVEIVKQGVGRVVELNLKLGNLKVDLGGSRPVSIPSGAIQRFVRPLKKGSFLWKKVVDPEGLSEEIRDDPPGSLAFVLEGFDGAISVGDIKSAVEGLLPMEDWSSWWTKARKNPRVLSAGSGSRLRYSISESAQDAARRLLGDLREADIVERPKIARNLAGRGGLAAEQAAAFLVEELDGIISPHPGIAWETAEALKLLPTGLNKAIEVQEILASTAPPTLLLEEIQDRSSRQLALDALRRLHPDNWNEIWAEWILHEKTPGLLDKMARALEDSGARLLLDTALETVFRNHLVHPYQFLWACDAMTAPDAPETIRMRMRPSLLEKIPDALSRREYSALRGKAKALLGPGKVAIRIILEGATPAQAHRFSQRIARINAVEPAQVRLVEQAVVQCRGRETSEEVDPGELLVASHEAIENARKELKQLLEEEIPKTLKGIQAAAAEGDLRENFEYHMLRDRQELHSARAAKLQEELARVRTIEHGAADPSRVNIGTIVFFEDSGENTSEPVTILGAWDADVEKRIYANGTDLARRLFGKSVGDEVEIDGHVIRIARIEAW